MIETDEIWFNLDDSDESASGVVEVAKELWRKQGEERIALAEDSLALYLGSNMHSLRGAASPMGMLELMNGDSSAYNLIQSVADTKINATIKNKIRPMFITEEANSETKKKAKAMQGACDGIMCECGLQGTKRTAVCVAGTLFQAGGVEWFADIANSRVVATPVWCWEYFVSRREARNGDPRQLFARHAIDRAVLLSYLKNAPKSVRDAVKEADPATWRDVYDDTKDPKKLSDQVIVYKAWHLPSGRVDLRDPRAYGKSESGNKATPNHDGRHVVAIEFGGDNRGKALIDIPWPHDHFPVSWYKPNLVPGSYWSRGEPEVLAAAQIEINRWNDREARIVNLHANPKTVVSKESGLNPAQLNNAPNNIYLVKGSVDAAVKVLAPPAIPPDLPQRTERIAQWAKDQRGMSDMSMSARKPVGVNHEPGMAYLADTETMRHTVEFESWEGWHLDSYTNIVRCLRDLAENDPNFEVVFEDDKQLRRYRWKDIDLADSYRMKLWPTNFLKQSPAQRADQIMDLVDRGALPPEDALEAIDAPDLGAMVGDRASMENNITRSLDRIVADGYTEMEFPTPYMDLDMAKRLGIQRLNELQADEESWQTQNEVIKFLEDVDDMIAKSKAPTAPTPGLGDTLGAMGPAAAAPPPPGPGGPPPMGAPPPMAA